MVTSTPGLMRSGLNPLRIIPLGVPASKAHRSTLPLGSFTSRKNHECGFSRQTCTIVPWTVTGLFISKAAANEWCAVAVVAAPSETRLHTRTVRTVRFIQDLLRELNHPVLCHVGSPPRQRRLEAMERQDSFESRRLRHRPSSADRSCFPGRRTRTSPGWVSTL